MKYLCDPQIIPAVIPHSFSEIVSRAELALGFAEWLHIDIDDGIFTPDKNWPIDGWRAALPEGISYEAHLMAADPGDIAHELIARGVLRLSAHREVFADDAVARDALVSWKAAGAREVGLALLIDTPLDSLDPVIDACDFVLLMSIAKVGHQGEPFDDRALTRVEELHAKYPDLMVAVDGGVSEASVEELVRAGANRLCVGSAIMKNADPAATYARIHERAMRGCAPLQTELAL